MMPMEPVVCNAPNASPMQAIFSLLKRLLALGSNGPSNVAHVAITPAGLTTHRNTMTIVTVERKDASSDGFFGKMSVDGKAVCETVENSAKAIEAGEYEAVIDLSPHLGYLCPHLRVPARDKAAGGDAGIRIHKANKPSQLLGCIATGTTRDGDAEDDSKAAFDKLMALLPPPGVKFTVRIVSL